MLQRLVGRVLLGAALLVGASSATAQQRPSLSVGAGAALPLSDLPEFYDWSAGLDLGLAVPLSQRLELTTGVTYNRFFFDGDAFANMLSRFSIGQREVRDFEFDGGAYSIASATAGMRYAVATPGWVTLYVTGATGLFYETIHDLDVEAYDVAGSPVEVGASAEGDDISYGLRLGVGARVPVASGVHLFVEPRYVLVFSETQYLPLRAGLSFSRLFGGSQAPAPAGAAGLARERAAGRYEWRLAYRRAFFSDGDLGGQDFRASVARRFSDEPTGLALGLSYRRAIDTEIRPETSGWADRQSVAADLLLFADVLRFTTGTTGHRLRVGAGPAFRHHWGEWPRGLFYPAAAPVDVDAHLDTYDRVYTAYLEGEGVQEGRYYLFTDVYRENEWGAGLDLQYNLLFERLVAGVTAGLRRYGSENVLGYGLHFGMHF